jgi:phosphoenolpyruvate-protein kinase (PTS system EI component)
VDFFSVGTNDLIQYLLAVDRDDPRLEGLYEPFHPAVLRTIAGIVGHAGMHGRPVSVCGEMATDPLAALVLMGLGVRELSMRPAAIPRIKEAVRRFRIGHLEDVARECLQLPGAAEIEERVRREFQQVVAEAAL